MSARVYLLSGGALLAALTFVVAALALAPPAETTELYLQRLNPGMEYGQVEHLFGRPADRSRGFVPSNPEGTAWWSDAEGETEVYFDGQGRLGHLPTCATLRTRAGPAPVPLPPPRLAWLVTAVCPRHAASASPSGGGVIRGVSVPSLGVLPHVRKSYGVSGLSGLRTSACARRSR
jgi:hypothetical protein